jgi:acetyl-CoA synthetase
MGTGKIVEAAVVGIPDPVGGAAIACVCVPIAGADEAALAQELSDAVVKAMGKAYRPKHVILVGDLPKTRTLKIMRRVVKALLLGTEPGDLSSLMNPEAIEPLKAKRINEEPS